MSAASNAAKDIKAEEEARQNRIKVGTEVIRHNFANSFNDDYYKNIERLGYEAVQPDFDKQYNDSIRQLQAALARNGLLGSTARGTLETGLEAQRRSGQQRVHDSVRGSLNARRQDVANAEMAAIGQLQASADPASAAAQAATLTAANSAAPRWSPLGQVFTDVTAGLATQADLERAGQNRYNLGISNWGNNVRNYTSNVGRI